MASGPAARTASPSRSSSARRRFASLRSRLEARSHEWCADHGSDGQGADGCRAARRRAREARRCRRSGGPRPRRHRAHYEGPARQPRARPGGRLARPRAAGVEGRQARRHVHERSAARGARGTVRGVDPRGTNSEGATWARVLGASAFATSGGFSGGYRGSYAALVVEPLCDDMTDPTSPKKRNGFWWTADRYLAKLDAPEQVGREATRRTVATLGSRKVETQECAIVFDPEVARSIVGAIFSVASGSSFWRKSTYLVGKEGEQVAIQLVTIIDDPLIPRAPGSRPFDGENLATRKNPVIEAGILAPVLCEGGA